MSSPHTEEKNVDTRLVAFAKKCGQSFFDQSLTVQQVIDGIANPNGKTVETTRKIREAIAQGDDDRKRAKGDITRSCVVGRRVLGRTSDGRFCP